MMPLEPAEAAVVPDETPAGAEEETNGEMVVTGSRIKRSPELASSAPVEVLDRKQIERTGASNAADLIQTLTAAQGSGYQGGGNAGNQGGGALGTSSVNLRGLGAASTLVLVNGRRLVPSGGGGGDESFSDISVIPMAAIERVEVLKGGGSAIYGADAVGGVVNIITRPSFDGLRLEVDGLGTSRGDHGEFTLSGSWGAKTDRSRVLIALSYLRRSELRADKRSFSKNADVDSNGQPGTFLIPGYDPMDPMRNRFVDPGCGAPGTGSAVTHAIVNRQPTSDELCTFNYSSTISLIGATERANVFGSGSYDLTKHATLFSELQLSRTRMNLSALSSYPVPPPLLTIPANHVDNPFGRDVTFIGRPLGLANGPQGTSISDDTYRAVVGLRGDFAEVGKDTFFEDWEWDLTGTWGASRYVSLTADTLRAPLMAAINSCSDPTNLSNCFNPFYSAVDGTGTPNSQSVIDSFNGTLTNISEHVLHTYHAGMSGSLFKLPGGDVGIAFGGEIRHERREAQEDHDANQQRYTFFLGYTDAAAARNVYGAYLELRWPFVKGLELQTAVRVERYTDIDRTTPSPFAGLTVTPGEMAGIDNTPRWLRRLHFTSSVTSAFRAPTLYQAYPGFAVVPTPLRVANNPLPQYTPVQNFGNPNLKPESALIFSTGLNWAPVDPLLLTLDLWQYIYSDRIAILPAQQVVDSDAMSTANGDPGDPRVIRDPMTGALSRVQLTQQNVPGHIKTTGIDFAAMVTLSGDNFGGSLNDWGSVTFGAQGTLTLDYTIPRAFAAVRTIPNTQPVQTRDPINCSASACDAVGSRNYNTIAPPLPRWRINVPVTWHYGQHSANVIAHFLSSILNDNDVHQDGSLGEMKAMITFDLQYGYTVKDWIGKQLDFRIGIYNVFDNLPPPTQDLNGFETLLYDPRGRMGYAKLIATY